MANSDREAEAAANYAVFRSLLPALLETAAGKFALMRHREVVGYFDTIGDAAKFGSSKFVDGIFSIQEVTERVLTFGYLSNAVRPSAVRPSSGTDSRDQNRGSDIVVEA